MGGEEGIMKHPDFNNMTIREIARYCKCHENKIRGRMSSGGGTKYHKKRTKEEASLSYLGGVEVVPAGTGWDVSLSERFHSMVLV